MIRIFFVPRRARVITTVVLVVVIAALGAFAQLGGPSGVRIPYSGQLERDGVPVDSEVPVTFRFTLWSAASGGVACGSYVHSSPVRGGRFSVEIGPVAESCLIAREVHLEVEVQGDAGFVALSGRQRVHPSVAAATSGIGDFFVTGTLGVGEDLVVDGDSFASSLRLSATTDLSLGSASSGVFSIGPTNGPNLAMDGNEIMARNNGAAERLYLNYEGGDVDVGGGSSTVRAPGTMVVGTLGVTGNATGFVRGGGTRRCTLNSATRLGCDAWGTGACVPTGSACGGPTCTKGTLAWSSGLNRCYDGGLGDYNAGCQTWVCVE